MHLHSLWQIKFFFKKKMKKKENEKIKDPQMKEECHNHLGEVR